MIVLNTARRKTGRFTDLMHAMRISWDLARTIPKVDIVSFHTSPGGSIIFGPAVWFLCKIFGKKWVLRGFGGRFEELHKGFSSPTRYLYNSTVLAASCLLFETQTSVRYFQNITDKPVIWYSNSRRGTSKEAYKSTSFYGARKFIYIGHVKPSKGIYEIIEAGEILVGEILENICIDIYGPLQGGIEEKDFLGRLTKYRGQLDQKQVAEVLKKYDVLILPTFYKGEGYPGVILEAYFAGVPVIATRWRAIPEIVNESSGILIPPKDEKSLAAAMKVLINSPQKLEMLREGAREMSQQFSSKIWTERFLEVLNLLMANGVKKPEKSAARLFSGGSK